MAFTFGSGGSGFGVPQQPAFSQFQQAAAPASTFGVQGFGAQPNAPAFGAQGMGGAQGFATPAPNQFAAAGAGFGTGFGAQPNAPAFGAQGMGGAQGFATPATGQFGAQGASGFGQAAPVSAFGAPAQQGGFGATGYAAPQGGFGAAAPATGFAAQGSGFGAAAAPNAFGAPSFNAAPASGGFGGTGFGAGAAPASSFNAGGTVGFQSQTFGAPSGFSKSAGDKGEGNMIVKSNCARMTDQSNESQRFKDYSTGNKGGQQGFGMAGAGGATAPFTQQAPSFLPATTGFQTGQQQTMPTPFGQQQQQQQQQAQPAFGSPFGVAAGNKATTPATAFNLFGGQAGAAATPFAANAFMPQATGTANPFGSIPTTAASSASLFPGAAIPPFGAAPASSGTLFAPAPFGLNNPPANNVGFQNLQPSGQFNNFALANSSAPAAPAPVSVVAASAPTSEAKYADVFSSRIELEDREGGQRHDSAVYARHHNIPLSRDQPPTLIWQSSSKTNKAITPMNVGNSTPRRAGTAISAPYRDGNPINRDEATVKPDNSNTKKALQLLHSSILPFWNRRFYSCEPWYSTEVEDPHKDKPLKDMNYVTKFSLCMKHPLGEPKKIDSYSVSSPHIDDTKEYLLRAESIARRRTMKMNPSSGEEEPHYDNVPVSLVMTVEGDSFSMLLDMITHKFGSRGFLRKDVADEEDVGDFFPFELCFEYETPPSHFKEKAHVPVFIHEDGMHSLDKVFYGFPCAEKKLSGMRHFSQRMDSDSLHVLSLQKPRSDDFPRLYLSFAFDSRFCNSHSESGGGKNHNNTMDFQFVATFDRKKLEEFDGVFKCTKRNPDGTDDDSAYENFLKDFHQYFEEQLKSSKFGDFNAETIPVPREINSLEGMGWKIEPLDRFIKALKTDPHQRGMSSSKWRFFVTQKI